LGKVLEDQTGVNFKLEFLVGDLKTKIGTMIASGDYPEVLIPDAAIEEVMNAGAFIPLDELIDKYGPNIKRVYGDFFNRMKAKDGKIYYLPIAVQVGKFIPEPDGGHGAFWVQRRVLEEAGYPTIKTLDQYIKLIKDYREKHKSEDLTGMVSLTHDWRFFVTANPPMHLMGYPNDGNVTVDLKTFEAKTYAANDATKTWLKTLNQLNADGLFDKASFVDNYDQYIAKLTSHKVLGFFDYGWQVANATNVLKDEARQDPTKDGYRYFKLPVTMSENIKDAYIDPPGLATNRGIGITTKAKDPVRIIQYFDNMLTEENQAMLGWGIKGETYEVNDKGRYYRTPEQITKLTEAFNEKFGFKYYNWNWPMYNTTSTLANGNARAPANQPEVFELDLTAKDKEILGKYNIKTYSDLFASPVDRPWFPAWGFTKGQNSPELIWETKKEEITKKYFPKLVLSTPDKFDSVWDEFTKEFNKLDTAGYEKWTTTEVKKLIDIAKGGK
jgi:putative aldouronate transport system substrate-binding protein